FYAISKKVMDIPNARSSHTVTTTRGGGLAIVLTFLLVVFFLPLFSILEWRQALLFLLGGGGVALLGFLDDHGHVAARWRLLGHFMAALVSLFLLTGVPPFKLLGYQWDLGWVGVVLFAFYLVWLLNLYNFMDGIDGLASLEAIFVCVGGALVYWMNDKAAFSLPPLLLAFAVLGFLFWNFPPAKIFMGDAGSGFLGLTLGVLSIQAMWVEPEFFWAWLILLGVFIVDATYTLARRLLRGDKVYEAHRSHAYQYASRHFG
ncbi:glycosyltransferase family 4 protein, partial [Pseudomonas aeruginosa]|uniref:MraY family glycosyltransferase n=1 Tax=Pseudomonas aeruginosa TaxID=287 RepID=UPI0031B6FDDA